MGSAENLQRQNLVRRKICRVSDFPGAGPNNFKKGLENWGISAQHHFEVDIWHREGEHRDTDHQHQPFEKFGHSENAF